MKDHPLDGHLGVEGLEQVPGNRLAFSILVCGQIELAGVLEQRLEFLYLSLLVFGDDIERLEVIFGVDAEPGPWL